MKPALLDGLLHYWIDEGRRSVCQPYPAHMATGTFLRAKFAAAENRCPECERGLETMKTWRRST